MGKRLAWQWQRTRRADPERAARHWLVLAVATLYAVATGTRAEDADWRGVAPALHAPPPPPDAPRRRTVSLARRGLSWLGDQLRHGTLWPQLWLAPEPWPPAPPHLALHTGTPP